MDPDYNTRIEAAYAVCACLSRADPQQVGYIISCTARPPAFSGFARNGRPASRAVALNPVGGTGNRDSSTPSSSPFLPSSSSLSPFSISAASRSSPFVGAAGTTLPTLGFGVFAAPRPVIEKPPPAILSFGGNNPCLRLIADMLELVCESDPMNSGSLKLCKAILRGLDNILDVGAQEAKLLGLTENPYARLFHEVQVSRAFSVTITYVWRCADSAAGAVYRVVVHCKRGRRYSLLHVVDPTSRKFREWNGFSCRSPPVTRCGVTPATCIVFAGGGVRAAVRDCKCRCSARGAIRASDAVPSYACLLFRGT